jgi:2-oxoisovalerate dehydrogenase E1 component
MATRPEIVDQRFTERVRSGDLPRSRTGATFDHRELGLSDAELIDLFETQVMSRHLDLMARILRERGQGFYTIGSSGHEGVASVGKAFRATDMAFLHYRSAGFFIQRLKMLPGATPLYDMLLSFAASAEDPIAGGRHKVLGSLAALVPPQTSTIASHLPKAVGAAFAIPRARALGVTLDVPTDAVVVCSFGDASANHSTSQGAFNTAEWIAYQGGGLPLVFVCEDNGLGISVRTPDRWIETVFSRRAELQYFACDGLDLLDTFQAARAAARYARERKRPAFLHVRTVRLFGHAGADAETVYRDLEAITRDEDDDPLLHSARILIERDLLDAAQILALYESVRARVGRVAVEAVSRPKLRTAEEVMAPIVAPRPFWRPLPPPSSAASRNEVFAKDADAMKSKQPMGRLIGWALADVLLRYPNAVVLGEDVGKKGGVYAVTAGLHERFGPRRVIDTVLDEQSILGVAIGMSHMGFVPLPEIQFLAYVHNAEDQLRGEAATLSFFSEGRFTNPMVVRVAGLPYQKGFGGHFHNDNSLAVFRDIPGLIVACPSNGADAVRMLRACVEAAQRERRVVIFVEPIALYMTRDLHAPKDLAWACAYPDPDESTIAVGELGVHGQGRDLCLISYANGHYLCRQAAQILEERHGLRCTLIDLRWIRPIEKRTLVETAERCAAVLIVDECRESGSPSEELMAAFVEHGTRHPPVRRLCASDSFIPLAEAATATLPSRDGIVVAALRLVGRAVA